ncbi:MAG: hypothetical protein AAF483_04935 [Planctomycetota bacterium]
MRSIPFLTDTLSSLNQALSLLSEIHVAVGMVQSDDQADAFMLASKQKKVDSALDLMKQIANSATLEYQGQVKQLFDGSFAISHTAASLSAVRESQIFEVDLPNGGTKNITVEVEQAAQPAEILIPRSVFDHGLASDVVLDIIGDLGRETFAFEAGTTGHQICGMINLFASDTGVDAKIIDEGMRLRSLEVGSQASIEISVVSEPTHGQLTNAIPQNAAQGCDALAMINGVPAQASSSSISLQTTKLDVFLNLHPQFEGKLSFVIHGGGVHLSASNNHADNSRRIGLMSLLPANLGGRSGRLFEIASGQRSCLSSDPRVAFDIISQAKNQLDRLIARLVVVKEREIEESAQKAMPQPAPEPKPARKKSFPNYRLTQPEAGHSQTAAPQILVQAGSSVLDFPDESADIFTRR